MKDFHKALRRGRAGVDRVADTSSKVIQQKARGVASIGISRGDNVINSRKFDNIVASANADAGAASIGISRGDNVIKFSAVDNIVASANADAGNASCLLLNNFGTGISDAIHPGASSSESFVKIFHAEL